MEPEQLQQAESAFRAVFAKANYTDPFNPRLGSRLLVYPIDYTILEPAQFEAVGAASIRSGAPQAYVAGYGGEELGWSGTYDHRLVDLHNYEDYRPSGGSRNLEHFLFAPNGEWGLVTSDGEYALVAGTAPFMANLQDSLGYDQEHVLRAFISDWRESARAGASVEWVPVLLDHVLGEDKGFRLWADSS